MLSISKPRSANNGFAYFQNDSYYDNRSNGRWFGKNIRELELNNDLNKDDFQKILNGVDKDGNVLVVNAINKKRRSYIDLTFSCPKSVSILSFSDDKIEQAHNDAVNKAVEVLQDNYSITREGAQGKNAYRTNNIISSIFNHHESRELDPHLHSHCLVMNLTKGNDGKYRSIEMSEIYKNQLYLGQIYKNELAINLNKLGYKIRITNLKNGTFEIDGVNEDIIKQFSTRREQVIEASKKYENKYIRNGEVFERAYLATRKTKKQIVVNELRDKIQNELKKYSTSLEKIKEIALNNNNISINKNEINSNDLSENNVEKINEKFNKNDKLFNNAIEDIIEHHSAFTKERILSLGLKYNLGLKSYEELNNEFNKNTHIISLGTKSKINNKKIKLDYNYYSTLDIAKTEKNIIELSKKKPSHNLVIDKNKIDNYLKKLKESGVLLSSGQISAIESICTSKKFISVIQGDAGSGKSYACEHVNNIMENNGTTVRGFAISGKAALELKNTGVNACTLDSFYLSKKDDVKENELWIIDEAGMIGSRDFEKIIQLADNHKAKLIFIGDKKQFPAIEQGSMFSELSMSKTVDFCEMREVKRQRTIHMKDAVSEIKKKDEVGIKNAFSILENNSCIKEIEGRIERVNQVLKDYLSDLANNKESIILAATNRDRNEINNSIKEVLLSNGIIEHGPRFTVLQNSNLSGTSRRFAQNYEQNQQIFFQSDCGDIKKGTKATIINVDMKTNSITVLLKDDNKMEVTKSIDLFNDATKIRAFNVREQEFGKGEHVITLKNDKLLGVENGKIGTVKRIDNEGNMDILFSRKKIYVKKDLLKADLCKSHIIIIPKEKIGTLNKNIEYRVSAIDRKNIVVEHKQEDGTVSKMSIKTEDLKHCDVFNEDVRSINLKQYPYVDLAYAVTSYKSQGVTLDNVRWYHDHTSKTNFNESYVAVTRARDDVVIYTNNKEKLVQQALEEVEKLSVLEFERRGQSLDFIPKQVIKKQSKELDFTATEVLSKSSNLKELSEEQSRSLDFIPKQVIEKQSKELDFTATEVLGKSSISKEVSEKPSIADSNKPKPQSPEMDF